MSDNKLIFNVYFGGKYELDAVKKNGVCKMCKILEKINGLDAGDILNEYYSEKTFPIDISKLLNNIGIVFSPFDFQSFFEQEEIKEIYKETDHKQVLGAVLAEEDDLNIYYRKNAGLNEIRFTLAHELGHCCKTMGTTSNLTLDFRTRESKLSPDSDEFKANVFAGELLIPEDKLREVYFKYKIKSINKLSKIFVVSTSVMRARLEYLNII